MDEIENRVGATVLPIARWQIDVVIAPGSGYATREAAAEDRAVLPAIGLFRRRIQVGNIDLLREVPGYEKGGRGRNQGECGFGRRGDVSGRQAN